MKMTREDAQVFYNLCTGETSGMHADIPIVPVVFSYCQAHKAISPQGFVNLLRSIADELDSGTENP